MRKAKRHQIHTRLMKKLPSFLLSLIPLSLFLISFLVRLSLISKGPFDVDNLGVMIKAQETLETLKLRYFLGTGYPGMILLACLFLSMGNMIGHSDPVFMVNLISVLFGALCIPLFYLITKKWFDTITAVLSTLLFSFSPLFLSLSTYGSNHPPSLFFTLLGLLYALTYHETRKRIHFYTAALAWGLVGAIRLQDLTMIAIPFSLIYLIGLMTNKERSSLSPSQIIGNFIYLWMIIFCIVYIFHLPYLLSPDISHYLKQLSDYLQVSSGFGTKGIFHDIFLEAFETLYKNFSTPGLLYVIGGFLLLWWRKRKIFIYCLLWIGVPLYFLMHCMNLAPRFFTIILPALYICAGFFFARMFALPCFIRCSFVIIFFLSVILIPLPILPILLDRHKFAYLPDYARLVGQLTEENARIITGDESSFLSYYGKRTAFGRPKNKYYTTEELMHFKQQLDALLDQNVPVYMTYSGLFSYNLKKRFSEFMLTHYEINIIGGTFFESWHRGAMKNKVMYGHIFEVHKRTVPPSTPLPPTPY